MTKNIPKIIGMHKRYLASERNSWSFYKKDKADVNIRRGAKERAHLKVLSVHFYIT